MKSERTCRKNSSRMARSAMTAVRLERMEPPSMDVLASGIEVERHVGADYLHFRVFPHELPQARHVGPDEPPRDPVGHIVNCHVEWYSIACMQQPSVAASHRHRAMPPGMTGQRDQPDLRLKM